MRKQRIFAGAPATFACALAVGILLFPGPGSAQVLGPHHLPMQPQAPSPRAKPDRTQEESAQAIEESNQTLDQPARIQYSYPLKGDDERRRSVKGLQQLTVDLLALHNIYKEAHWDLTGPLYVQLHEYYQKQADFYLQQADTLAGRVLHLGGLDGTKFCNTTPGDIARFQGLFQAPTTRNVDLRPDPTFVKAYFPNGWAKSLETLVHFYNTRNLASAVDANGNTVGS
jgi:hypothetical protein